MTSQKGEQANNKNIFSKAAKWFCAQIQYLIGKCYYNGFFGKKKSEDKAIVWFRKAAQAGLWKAQWKLGHMLPYNDPEAHYWLNECGDTEEADNLLDIHERMI